MTAITREFRLYTNAGLSIPPVIHVNQYDQGETWNFKLYQPNGQQFIPTDAAIVGVKADGNLIANAGTVSDGVVVITETEQMTAAPGKAVFEILFDGDTHGTANFVVLVEASPTNDGVASESDLSLFQEAIDSTSPAAIAQGVSDWMDEHLTPTTPVVDDTLTVQGAAADAKKTGDEIADLKSAISTLSAIPHEVKLAMDTLFSKMGVGDDDGYTSAYGTIHAWATAVNVVSITAEYEQGQNVIYTTSPLDDLRQYLTVTATYNDGTSDVVTDYQLSGDLDEGTNEITVSYLDKTATFNATATVGILYTAERGLLSEQSYITATGIENITEAIVGDALRLYSPVNSSEPIAEFNITEPTFSNELTMKCEFKLVNTIPVSASNTGNYGSPRFKFYNGSKASIIGFSTVSSAPKIRYFNSTNWSLTVADISLNAWHVLELIIENDKQTIKVDDTAIVTNCDIPSADSVVQQIQLATSTNGAVDVYIRSLEISYE